MAGQGQAEDNVYGGTEGRDAMYVVCLKPSVNGTRKQTKQKIQTN
jgi:hypothetical protein